MTTKLDFKRKLKELYLPPADHFTVVHVPPLQFLMIDGHGDPNVAPAYTEAVEALFSVAFKVKFISKKDLGQDYVVMPLEGLWWAEDMETYTTRRDKSQWDWTMMIMQPDWISAALFTEARAQVAHRNALPALPKLRLETYAEGLSVQVLHIGSFEAEGPVLHRMHQEFMPDNGYTLSGKHHEIYLSDPRRVEPGNLKTVLRQPVSKRNGKPG